MKLQVEIASSPSLGEKYETRSGVKVSARKILTSTLEVTGLKCIRCWFDSPRKIGKHLGLMGFENFQVNFNDKLLRHFNINYKVATNHFASSKLSFDPLRPVFCKEKLAYVTHKPKQN